MVTTPKKASFYLKIIGGVDSLQEQIHKLDFIEAIALQKLDSYKLNQFIFILKK